MGREQIHTEKESFKCSLLLLSEVVSVRNGKAFDYETLFQKLPTFFQTT